MADIKVLARKYYDGCMEVFELGKQRDALQMQITEKQRQLEPVTHALKDSVGNNITERHIVLTGTKWMLVVKFTNGHVKDNVVKLVEIEYVEGN